MVVRSYVASNNVRRGELFCMGKPSFTRNNVRIFREHHTVLMAGARAGRVRVGTGRGYVSGQLMKDFGMETHRRLWRRGLHGPASVSGCSCSFHATLFLMLFPSLEHISLLSRYQLGTIYAKTKSQLECYLPSRSPLAPD